MVEENRKRELFLADDSQIIRIKVGRALRDAGYTVNEFTNGDDIIAKIRELGKDKDVVVITDNQMPNSDGTKRQNNGIEVLNAASLKAEELKHTNPEVIIKTIMISASLPSEQSKEVVAAGTKADAHFDKTDKDYIPDLVNKVGKLLQYTPTPLQQTSTGRVV
ncbi:MAG: response regulator [Pseudomonadota bacterium]